MIQTSHPSRLPGLQPAHARSIRGGPSPRSNTVAVALLIALAAYGFARFEHEPSHEHHAHAVVANRDGTLLAAPFARPLELGSPCDGRSTCAQMTSCAEAKVFLRSCAGVLLDRDGNGIPCERTWCNSPLAN